MADVEEGGVVVAHRERATLRLGDVFLKIDADQTRIDVEVAAMEIAPIPTPVVLWRMPPVLAIAAVPRDGARPPRRAVDRVRGGSGGSNRRSDAPGPRVDPQLGYAGRVEEDGDPPVHGVWRRRMVP